MTDTNRRLAIAERQLATLSELARIGLEVSRAYGAAALAASHAVEVILADEYWQPETGRARALAGSKDAADGYQKASRSLRLTLALELKTAEYMDDLEAGVPRPVRNSDAGERPVFDDATREGNAGQVRDSPDRDRKNADCERLVDVEHADRAPRGTFREVVDSLCANFGIVPDWESYGAGKRAIRYEPLQPRPPGWSECRPPGSTAPGDPPGPVDREAALPP